MNEDQGRKFDPARIATIEMLVRLGEWRGLEIHVPPHFRTCATSKFGEEVPDSAIDAPAELG